MFDAIMHNKLTIGGLACIIAVSAWYLLGGSSTVSQEGLVTETFVTPASEAERDLVATLLELRTVTLDGEIFSDPAFQSLRDFGSQIIPEPVGRPNPFKPLTQSSAVGSITGATSSPRVQR